MWSPTQQSTAHTCSLRQMPQNTRKYQGARHQHLIQSDSGKRVNILGGDNMGFCEKKSIYELVSNSECLPR
jgi:hypothetical protein